MLSVVVEHSCVQTESGFLKHAIAKLCKVVLEDEEEVREMEGRVCLSMLCLILLFPLKGWAASKASWPYLKPSSPYFDLMFFLLWCYFCNLSRHSESS